MSGRSRVVIETEIKRPIPGRENTFSTMIDPPRISAAIMPRMVITGMREFLSTWEYIILASPAPLLLAVRTYSFPISFVMDTLTYLINMEEVPIAIESDGSISDLNHGISPSEMGV